MQYHQGQVTVERMAVQRSRMPWGESNGQQVRAEVRLAERWGIPESARL
jgi:hypothetical protein